MSVERTRCSGGMGMSLTRRLEARFASLELKLERIDGRITLMQWRVR
jgi:hypothetical protein